MEYHYTSEMGFKLARALMHESLRNLVESSDNTDYTLRLAYLSQIAYYSRFLGSEEWDRYNNMPTSMGQRFYRMN